MLEPRRVTRYKTPPIKQQHRIFTRNYILPCDSATLETHTIFNGNSNFHTSGDKRCISLDIITVAMKYRKCIIACRIGKIELQYTENLTNEH